jgi:tetratricopeptide (TPR) repeat protein
MLLILVFFFLSDSLHVDSIQVDTLKLMPVDSNLVKKDSLTSPPPVKKPVHKISVASLIKKADKAFVAIDYELADSLYKQAYAIDSTNANLHWKMARLYVCIGDGINPLQKDKRAPYYHKAVEFARKSIALNDQNSDAYTWFAAALGVSAENSSSKEQIKHANEIKSAIDKALALNPNDDVAYSILGSFYHSVSDIGWFERVFANTFLGSVPDGSFELSEKAFRKAIELDSTIIRHYYEFALLYMDWGKPKKALTLLKQAQDLPVKMKNDRRRKREMKQMIAELEDQLR